METGGCALEERLPQSIAKYVPRLSLSDSIGEGTWRLAVSSRPSEVEIVLFDDSDAKQLHRVLRAEPEACAAAADGIGLILERYLSDLGYETGFAPLPEIGTATVVPPEIAPPRILVLIAEPTSYAGTSTVARLRWETSGATETRLLLNDRLDVAFPGGTSGTHTTTISGSVKLVLVATNDADSASAEIEVVQRRLPEPVRGITLDLGAGALAIGGVGLRAGGLLDLALEVPVLELFTADVRKPGQTTLEIATLTVRTELSFFGVADGPGRLSILRNDSVLGEYLVWTIGGLAKVGACADLIAVVMCVSGGAGVERAAASTQGARLFDRKKKTEVGALLEVAVRLALKVGRIMPYVRGSMGIRPDPMRFVVFGADNAYEEPVLFGFVSLGLAVQLF